MPCKLREGFAEENGWLLTKGSNTASLSRLRKQCLITEARLPRWQGILAISKPTRTVGEACLAPTGRDVWAGHCPTQHVQDLRDA